jgi:hypothetical protein
MTAAERLSQRLNLWGWDGGTIELEAETVKGTCLNEVR